MIQNLAVQKQSPLTGRQHELHQLWDLFEASTTGHTHVVFVSGEPGIGKSRLLQEIALRAKEVGALVLHGGASEAEGMPPYLAFLEALGSYIRATPPEQLRDQAGSMAPVLATIMPELTMALGELPGSYPLPPEQARLRLFEAVGMFLAAIATTAPLVLLLDDLQWADPASLDLLHHVARQQFTARLLILGAYRTGELVNNPALERTLLDLNRARMLTSLTISPLTEEEITALAAARLGLPVDPAVARLLHIHSEGNPFFAEELLRAWVETDALSSTEEAQHWFQERKDQLGVARAAHGLGRAWVRLEAHSSAQAAFEAALALLKDHSGSEMVQILVDLATLLAVSLGKQAEGISYGQRALDLSRRLANKHLEAMANRTLGNLLMRGNDIKAALPLLEHALKLADTSDDPAEAAECCACLTLAYLWSGHVQRAQQITFCQMEFAKHCHEPYQLRHIYSWLAMLSLVQGQFTDAEQLLIQAQSAVGSLASPEPLALLQLFRGILSCYKGDYDTAEQQFRTALVVFREIGSNALLWQLAPLGIVQLLQGKQHEALACMGEVETLLASQQEGMILTADALSKVAMMAVMMGDEQRVARYYPKLVTFQGLYIDFLIDRVLGEMETLMGTWSQAQDHLSRAEAMARREGLVPEVAWTLSAQGRLALAKGGRGSVTHARKLFEQAHDLFEQLGMQGEAQALREQLEHLPGKSPARKARPLPAGLSEREVEVMRLVVAGKSNRQIAGELILSERTVANHLAHIFNKTGTDNRAAAAAFAIRHGLA
jgi:DNA-binding CsgD family transcriptional regulator